MPRAALYNETGAPDVLYVDDVPTPPVDADRVRIAVRAAGINPVDSKLRSGFIPVPAEVPFPRGVGGDYAGVVLEAGPTATYTDGTTVEIGDEVLGWTMGEAIREELVVPASNLARKPAALAFTVAGGLVTPALTAQAAIDRNGISADDTVLVSAAAGGVGLLYSQLALAIGATVIGTASEANHDRLRALGIIPVAYGEGRAERVREASPTPITAVQDNHGRETVEAAVALGVPRERICTIVDYGTVDEFGIISPGRYERRPDTLETLAERVADGELTLPIQELFPLDRVADAFRVSEERHLLGKLIVTP